MIWLLACRPAPIERPNNPWLDTAASEDPETNDYDPYEEGEERLSLGIFYEGESSERIPIDEQSAVFNIWVVEGTSIPTFSIIADPDSVEGLTSDQLIASDAGWFGGGIAWLAERDLSKWDTLHISVRSEEDAMTNFKLGMGGRYKQGGSCTGSGSRQNWRSLDDYGFVPDGEWHHLEIPVDDFTICLDIEAIVEPFNLLMAPLSTEDSGKSIFIDKLFFTVD